MTIEDITLLITPVSILLLCLIFVLKLRRDVNPIVVSVVKGLSIQAQSNSMFFAQMFLVGFAIFFVTVGDGISPLGYVKSALLCKAIGVTCQGVLAYLIKSTFNPEPKIISTEKTSLVISEKTP